MNNDLTFHFGSFVKSNYVQKSNGDMMNINKWRDSDAKTKAVNKYGDTAADRRLIDEAKKAQKGQKKVMTKALSPKPVKAVPATIKKNLFLKK